MEQLPELPECVGIDAIVIPDKGAAPINSDAIKTSAGALYNVKICKENNLAHVGRFSSAIQELPFLQPLKRQKK